MPQVSAKISEARWWLSFYLEATDRDGEENEGLMEMGGHQRLMIVSTC